MVDKIIPIVRFTHAELKNPDKLNAHLETVKVASRKKSKLFTSIEPHTNGHGNCDSKRLKLTIQDAEMSYEGVEEDDCPYVLGVVPKDGQSKQRITLFRTAYFVLKPECYLRASDSEHDDAESQQPSASSSFADKLNSLTAAFGSSKKRKAMQSKLKNRIDAHTLEGAMDAAVRETLNGHDEEAADEKGESSSNDYLKANIQQQQFTVFPEPNVNAKTPHECYNLFDMFELQNGQDELDRCTNACAIWFAETKVEMVKEWIKTGAYPVYVCERLLSISASKLGHKQKMAKFKLLSFMHYLITMFRMKQSQFKSKAVLISSQVPDTVIKKMYDFYTISSSGSGASSSKKSTPGRATAPTMPQRLRDKLAAHILVLAWHIDDFSTDLSAFKVDLKMSEARLQNFYRALGAHLSNQVVMSATSGKKVMVKVAELKLPLPENRHLISAKRKNTSK